jgi:hypothetical protein
MKILLINIFATFLICTGVFAQTIDQLDKKNGFKDFALGDGFSKWQSQLKLERNWDDGSRTYLYRGTCCNMVFNYPVEKIQLKFKNNKLVVISITTEKFQKGYRESGEYSKWRPDDFESIKASIATLFGEPTLYDPVGSLNVTYIWKGKRVLLTSEYQYLGGQDGDRQLINISDLSYVYSELKRGF